MVFSKASYLVPGERLRETKHWLVIRHPQPAYPVHLLLLPKHDYPDWPSIALTETELLSEYLELTRDLIRELNLEKDGYRLIVNGGKYQEFPHLHIHLVSGDAK